MYCTSTAVSYGIRQPLRPLPPPATAWAEGFGWPFPLPPDTQLNGRPSPRERAGVKVATLPAPTQWRRRGPAGQTPKPLTLTLSRRERGQRSTAKQLLCFYTKSTVGSPG